MTNQKVTLETAVLTADAARPANAYPMEMKTKWVSEVERKLAMSVRFEKANSLQDYVWSTDKTTQLKIASPYDNLYWLYIISMIDFYNGDTERYANSLAEYNKALEEYRTWYRYDQASQVI